ncbi:DUF192 domain-containing protein [Vasconcelosia minhoensis]|uniref:DUF192 domain-containing protein n=1 Tax=Vasconcelosia minhoensis TaxID=3366354 RepID=UPI002AD59333|nr:DUF192 domain-containing protein [Romeria gracilis]
MKPDAAIAGFCRRSWQLSLVGLSCLLLSCSVPGAISESPTPAAETDPMTLPADRPTPAADSTAPLPETTLLGPGQLLPVTAEAEMAGQTFQLEVAETPQQQAMGLMYRTPLPDNRGMLFSFASPRRTAFWMKDVPVPLDMVFLRQGQVAAISPSVPPCETDPCPTYGPGSQLIDQVIELRAGRAAEIGLQPGDPVTISPL